MTLAEYVEKILKPQTLEMLGNGKFILINIAPSLQNLMALYCIDPTLSTNYMLRRKTYILNL